MTKPISFKTAFLIVIGIHVFGFLLLTQWSSFRYKLSKMEWAERKEKLLRTSNETAWPELKNDKLVVTPVPPKKPKETKPITLTKKQPTDQKPRLVASNKASILTNKPSPKPKATPTFRVYPPRPSTSSQIVIVDPRPIEKKYSNMPLTISRSPKATSQPIKIEYFQDGVTYQETIQVRTYTQL